MRFGFEEILEQHRSDLNGRDQLSTETRRRLERQVTIIRTSIYATPRNSRSDVIQSGPAANTVRA